MTDESTDTETLELLRALGQVDPPSPAVLAAARHQLRSAIADELLTAGATEAQPRERQQPAPRRRPGQTRPENRQRHVPPSAG